MSAAASHKKLETLYTAANGLAFCIAPNSLYPVMHRDTTRAGGVRVSGVIGIAYGNSESHLDVVWGKYEGFDEGLLEEELLKWDRGFGKETTGQKSMAERQLPLKPSRWQVYHLTQNGSLSGYKLRTADRVTAGKQKCPKNLAYTESPDELLRELHSYNTELRMRIKSSDAKELTEELRSLISATTF